MILLAAAGMLAVSAGAADSGRAPLMGWSSWNTYGLDINGEVRIEGCGIYVHQY